MIRRLLVLMLFCAGTGAMAQTGAESAGAAGRPTEAEDPVSGEWACALRYGRGEAGFRRKVVVIFDPDGSFLVQGRQTESFLVLGKWFRAPSGAIFGSGRVQRFGRGGLGQLFALELRVEGERLVSDQDPRAECRRP